MFAKIANLPEVGDYLAGIALLLFLTVICVYPT